MSWAEIKKALNSTLGTADFKPLDEAIKSAPTYGTVVKSIQQGIIAETPAQITVANKDGVLMYLDVTISAVDINKSLCFVDTTPWYSDDDGYHIAPRLIDSTTLRLYLVCEKSSLGSSTKQWMPTTVWQVIEFV